MSETKTRFRTIQDEYFEPVDTEVEDVAPPVSSGKFIAIVIAGVVVAASLATVLSVAF